ALPVNQGAVAVEGQDFEASQVEHGRSGESMPSVVGFRFPASNTRRSSLALLDFERLREGERECGLCREDDVLVAGKSGAPGACTATSHCTDRWALTSARQAANQRTERGSAPGHYGGAFAFA